MYGGGGGGWGGRTKLRDIPPPCDISPITRPFWVVKGPLGAGPADARPLGWRESVGPPPTGEARLGSVEQGTLGCRGAGIPQWPRPLARPLAAASVAMRCCETPVNKPCLDSGARAQGLFA